MTKQKPNPEILAFQKAEQEKFWQLHPGLESEMRASWSAAGKTWKPSTAERSYLELYYGQEKGYYDPAVNPMQEIIYFPELSYRDLLKFLIADHNAVVQSIRDDAESTKQYLTWLKQNNPLDFLKESVSTLVTGALVILGIYLIAK